MRIISGKAGGIALSVPKGEVRPTTDRVREALFSILNPLIDHADVLDLFTGSGAFGLEALSRGAGSSRMVDFSRLSCATAKANLAKTGLEGGAVIQGDAVQFVKRELLAGRKYDCFCRSPLLQGPGGPGFYCGAGGGRNCRTVEGRRRVYCGSAGRLGNLHGRRRGV